MSKYLVAVGQVEIYTLSVYISVCSHYAFDLFYWTPPQLSSDSPQQINIFLLRCSWKDWLIWQWYYCICIPQLYTWFILGHGTNKVYIAKWFTSCLIPYTNHVLLAYIYMYACRIYIWSNLAATILEWLSLTVVPLLYKSGSFSIQRVLHPASWMSSPTSSIVCQRHLSILSVVKNVTHNVISDVMRRHHLRQRRV